MRDPVTIYRSLISLGSSPAFSWYSETGRVELSGKVAANHLAKIAGYLRDDVWLDAGTSLVLDLPASYKTLLWSLGSLLAGARISFHDASTNASLDATGTFGIVTNRPESVTDATDVMALDLGALAFSWTGPELPPGVRDAAAEVMGAPDVLMDEASWEESNWDEWGSDLRAEADGSQIRHEGAARFLENPTPAQALRAAMESLGCQRLVVAAGIAETRHIKIAERLEDMEY